MKLKIVNTKKFFRMIILILAIIIFLLCIGFNTTYSRTELKYKEEYVGQGDTLWSIVERQYNTNLYFKDKDIRDVIYEIKKINNLADGNLKIGQKILIPTIY